MENQERPEDLASRLDSIDRKLSDLGALRLEISKVLDGVERLQAMSIGKALSDELEDAGSFAKARLTRMGTCPESALNKGLTARLAARRRQLQKAETESRERDAHRQSIGPIDSGDVPERPEREAQGRLSVKKPVHAVPSITTGRRSIGRKSVTSLIGHPNSAMRKSVGDRTEAAIKPKPPPPEAWQPQESANQRRGSAEPLSGDNHSKHVESKDSSGRMMSIASGVEDFNEAERPARSKTPPTPPPEISPRMPTSPNLLPVESGPGTRPAGSASQLSALDGEMMCMCPSLRGDGDEPVRTQTGGGGTGKEEYERIKSVRENVLQIEKQSWVLLPDAPARLVWDGLMALSIMYASMVSTIAVAYLSRPDIESLTVDWSFLLMDICWLINMALNFATGFMDPASGEIVVDTQVIAIRYARTWLVIDLMSLCPTAIAPMWDDREGAILKTLLALKALRMLRLGGIILNFDRCIRSMSLGVLKWGLQLFLASHVLACLWRFAQWSSGMAEEPVRGGPGWWDLYVQDAYWVLMTMSTVGYGDISPSNTDTRLYAIGVMLIAWLFFGLVVSTLQRVMSRIFDDKVEVRITEAVVFMRRRHVPKDIQFRVERALRHNMTQTSQAVMDPELFELLSPGLQNELSLALLGNAVLMFPLFDGALHSFIAELAQAHSWIQCGRGELVAESGQLITEMVFVVQGQLVAEFGPGSDGEFFDVDVSNVVDIDTGGNSNALLIEEYDNVVLGVGSWFGEACLFKRKHVRVADFIAALDSDLAVLPAESYERVVAKYPVLLARHNQIQAAMDEGRMDLSMLAWLRQNGDEVVRASTFSAYSMKSETSRRSGGQGLSRVEVEPFKFEVNQVVPDASGVDYTRLTTASAFSTNTQKSSKSVNSLTGRSSPTPAQATR